MECLECPCDMRVSFSLLTDSQNDGASPWDVVAIVLQVVGAMDRLIVYLTNRTSAVSGDLYVDSLAEAEPAPRSSIKFRRHCETRR
jgi:hypothetical protein